MSDADPADQTTLSIPSLLLFLALLALAIRYFFFNSAALPTAPHPGARTPRVPPAAIDAVAAMFPQLTRRDIEWDLRRNGASVQATTERVLRTGALDPAPPSFRAQTPPPASRAGAPPSGSAPARSHPDLIARYNLGARVANATGTSELGSTVDKGAWSASKSERADALKRRREEMVLEARRRMLEREKGKGRAA